jgi:hypothetical protein
MMKRKASLWQENRDMPKKGFSRDGCAVYNGPGSFTAYLNIIR